MSRKTLCTELLAGAINEGRESRGLLLLRRMKGSECVEKSTSGRMRSRLSIGRVKRLSVCRLVASSVVGGL